VQESYYLTAEALRTRSKEFLIEEYSELGELCASCGAEIFSLKP
jgi:hypothetical protein